MKNWIICFVLTFCVVDLFSQATHVQTLWQWNGPNSTASSLSLTLLSNSGTGNLVVVHVSYSGQTASVSTITDSKSNSYSRVNGPTNWGGINYYRSELWYAYNITGVTTPKLSITVTMTGTPPVSTDGLQFIQVYASEFSGIGSSNPLDQKSTNIGSASSNFNSGSAIVNYSNELIYGAAIGGSMSPINKGATFTSINNNNSNRIEYKNVTPAGTYNADFNPSAGGGTFVADLATFRTSTSVLPIELLSFNAVASESGAVLIDWATASEINNDYFEILRSVDGKNWDAIIRLNGAGNSKSLINYSAQDDHPQRGVNYYQLKQVDFDGKSTLSEIRAVEVKNVSISFYPNPTTNWLTIDGLSSSSTVLVFNSIGSLISGVPMEETNGGVRLNFTQLTEGLYLIKTPSQSVKILKK